jgi:D-aminopeptidase
VLAYSEMKQLDALFAPHDRSDAPGIVVGIAQHGRTIYRRGFGLASVQHGVMNTPATRMRIGSTSKHFACLAALLLAEDGSLDVDAPATRWLPELPALQVVPTLRQFMQHTSGYRCGLQLGMTANGDAWQPGGWMLRTMTRQREVNFPPGHGQIYCNGGYHLLSIAIERVAGMSLADFMRERIFEPLEMRDTALVPSDRWITPGAASLHMARPASQGKGWSTGQLYSNEVLGEGGIISSIDDMLRWAVHLRSADKRVGSAESWRQMFEPAVLSGGIVSTYSLGLSHGRYKGLVTVSHAGGVIGGNSQMMCVPDHGLDVVIMANSYTASAGALAEQVIDTLLAGHLGAGPTRPQLARFRHLVGRRWHGPSGHLVGFDEAGDLISVSVFGTPPAPLLHDCGATLEARFADASFGPVALRVAELGEGEGAQVPEEITWLESGQPHRLRLLPSTPPAEGEAAKAIVGRWRAHDLVADALIEWIDDMLLLRLRGDCGPERTLRLEPLSEAAFMLSNPEEPLERCVLSAQTRGGQAEFLFLDSVRARHVRFERA